MTSVSVREAKQCPFACNSLRRSRKLYISPLYVIQIKNETRQVVVGKDEELYSRTLTASRVNLISTADLREPMRVTVKIRHKHQPAPGTIESAGPDQVRVTFDEPQRALTPGQAAVFYDGDVVVGGGWINVSH